MPSNEGIERGGSIQEQLAQRAPELARLRAALDLAFCRGATSSSAPEDLVIFPLGVSCKDILEEILAEVAAGHGRSALRSARTMYECMVFSRYIRLHPEKSAAFLDKFSTQWAKIIQTLPDVEKNLPEMHKTLASKVPKYGGGKPVGVGDLNWSSTWTYEMAKEAGKLSELHSLAFDYASAFVHPSSVFILSQMSQPTPDGSIQVGAKPQDEEARQALRVAHDLALNAVDLRLEYSPSQVLQQQFEQCTRDFVGIWGYPPHV